MAYTGHKERTIRGQTIVEHIRDGVKAEARHRGIAIPTDEQMALVVYQLRMHTTLEHAARYDTSELGKPDVVTEYWPIESSIGRFFRDSAELTFEQPNPLEGEQ